MKPTTTSQFVAVVVTVCLLLFFCSSSPGLVRASIANGDAPLALAWSQELGGEGTFSPSISEDGPNGLVTVPIIDLSDFSNKLAAISLADGKLKWLRGGITPKDSGCEGFDNKGMPFVGSALLGTGLVVADFKLILGDAQCGGYALLDAKVPCSTETHITIRSCNINWQVH